MAWFRFWNNSSAMPVHVAIEWGGILQHWRNNIPVGGYWEVDVPGLGWHGIEVRAANGKNHFDPSRDNLFGVANIAISSVAVVVAAAGIVLIPFTAGSSVFVTAAAVATAAAGGVVSATGIAFAIGSAIVYPVSLSNMYGPDGYNLHIRGGDLIGSYDERTKKFIVTSFSPLLVEWRNNVSHASGVEKA